MTDRKKLLPLLKVIPSDLAIAALVVGDPQRAASAAELLTNVKEVGNNREYQTFTGNFNGKLVTISSHGIGGAGASICFEELIQGGVRTIIRAGTCGGMKKGIQDGDLIIGTGAIREDGTADLLVPIAYPAISDRHVVSALSSAAAAAATDQTTNRVHEGIILTQGFFYPGILPSTQNLWLGADMDLLAVEMELATLLIIASMRRIQAGGVFTVDGNMTEESDMKEYDPHRKVVTDGVASMLRIALDALTRLI